MKKLLIIILLCLSFFSFAQKEMNEKWLEIPENMKEHASAIVREYKVEYLLKSVNDLEQQVWMVMTILDNDGKRFANQVWHYDVFSKITSGDIQIFDKTGERLEKKSLRDMEDYGTSGMANFYDDSRLKVYTPLIKETPYTIIITYSKKYSGFFQLPAWYPQSNSKIAVEKASLSLINSGNVAFKIKAENLDTALYVYSESNQTQTWEVQNIKAFKPESFAKDAQLSSITFPLKNFQVQGFAGKTDSWAEFGKWISDLNADRDKVTDETVQKIKTMVKDISDPKEKAKIIYAWMQENTRYISIQYGIGGWQPYNAIETDQLKYGDCKALTNYTKALFSAVGINSYYSLVQAGEGEKNLDPAFPSNQFNHVILCVPFETDTTWVECTADNIAFGYLGDFTDDRYALVIDGNQSKLVKTTAYPKENNLQIRTANMIVNSDGSIKAHIQTKYTGIQYNNRRAQINEDEKDRKDYLYKTISISGFTIKSLSYEYKKEILPVIIENMELTASKYASVTGNRLFIPLNLMNQHNYIPDKDTIRKKNIFLSMAFCDVDSLIFQIPKDYEIDRLPKETILESIYGKYSMSISTEGNKIIYIRKIEQNSGEFPAETWADFRKYKLEIVKADKATAILKKVII